MSTLTYLIGHKVRSSFILTTVLIGQIFAQSPRPGGLIISSETTGGSGHVSFVNLEVGAGALYDRGMFGQTTVIANVEAGHVWGGHDVFDRSELAGFPPVPSVKLNAAPNAETAPQLGEYDYHATMVGHVLAGTGLTETGTFGSLGMGMAPVSGLWSGAVATSFDPVNIGSFSISTESFLTPYVGFFNGIPEGRPDVINSSWGFQGEGGSYITQVIDALASANPTVASVVSAGNSGPEGGTVGEPASGYNNIAVGALQAAEFDGQNTEPTGFTSRGPSAFYNPETGELIENVRASVHLAAPGEHMALAAYLGNTGGYTGLNFTEEEPSTDQYFSYNQSGTSFSAPVVAGGIALLKDFANQTGLSSVGEAYDTRVMRSVLMAGAAETPGWSNNQTLENGVIVTTQALDHATGAGRLDLERALEVYGFHTTNLAGLDGGGVSATGWDFGRVSQGMSNAYTFNSSFEAETELSIALNWFAHQEFDPETGDLVEGSARFANLDLEVWTLEDGEFTSLHATSASTYNNTEFLRLFFPEGGEFGFRILFDDWVYGSSSGHDSEDYAVAWSVAVIPEPASLLLAAMLLALACGRHPRRRRFLRWGGRRHRAGI